MGYLWWSKCLWQVVKMSEQMGCQGGQNSSDVQDISARQRLGYFDSDNPLKVLIRTIACWKETAVAPTALTSDSCTISYS